MYEINVFIFCCLTLLRLHLAFVCAWRCNYREICWTEVLMHVASTCQGNQYGFHTDLKAYAKLFISIVSVRKSLGRDVAKHLPCMLSISLVRRPQYSWCSLLHGDDTKRLLNFISNIFLCRYWRSMYAFLIVVDLVITQLQCCKTPIMNAFLSIVGKL